MEEYVDTDGNILAEFEESVGEHFYSLLIFRKPWIVLPLHGKASVSEDLKIIDIEERMDKVLNSIKRSNYGQSLKDWTRTVNPHVKYEENSEYICFNVADYVASLFMEIYDSTYSKAGFSRIKVELDIKRIDSLYGVFHMEISNNYEDHMFLAWFRNDTIHIVNGYGGHCQNPIYKITPRKVWINKYKKMINSKTNVSVQIQIMNELFGLLYDIMREIYETKEVHIKMSRNITYIYIYIRLA